MVSLSPVSPKSPVQKMMKTSESEISSRVVDCTPPVPAGPKRTKSPGVRVIGGRIYDSENGKSCHQCRQKTLDLVAECKVTRKATNKPCTLKFCHKCLLNRYGEKVEEVSQVDNWECPKCRDLCNCSLCWKKKGYKPTGIMVHTAKATGYSSVIQYLNHNMDSSQKEPSVTSTRKQGKKHDLYSDLESSAPVPNSKKRRNLEKSKGNDEGGDDDDFQSEKRSKTEYDADIPLPWGFDFSVEDVGDALQFIEFCNAFGQVEDSHGAGDESRTARRRRSETRPSFTLVDGDMKAGGGDTMLLMLMDCLGL